MKDSAKGQFFENPAYGRPQLSQPMRIVAPILFSFLFLLGCARGLGGGLHPIHESNLEQLLVFKAPPGDYTRVQSRTPCFQGSTRGRSMSPIRKNSLFLRLHAGTIHDSNPEQLLVFKAPCREDPTCLFTRLESSLVPAGFLTAQFLQET